MELLRELLDEVSVLLPLAGTLVLVVVGLAISHAVLERVGQDLSGRKFRNQLVMSALTFAGLILVVLALPISEATRGQLLSLIGILLSAAIALSSTTLLGNAMAGIMLRAVRNFRSGDFIRCEQHEGRVSERGLFHTEIQTPDRELTTVPNLFLVTHPMTVVRSSGTIVSATLSLGYDVAHDQIEAALLDAARHCDLEEPFVHVTDLGDFSVTYRIAGLLKETKRLLSVRSALRVASLDALHRAGIEIVSPNFMNTRAFDPDRQFVPKVARRAAAKLDEESNIEDLIFDKAEEAETREQLVERLAVLRKAIETTREAAKDAEDEALRASLEGRVTRLEERRAKIEAQVTPSKND